MFVSRTLSSALLALMLCAGGVALAAPGAGPMSESSLAPGVADPAASEPDVGGHININTATAEELAWLPGVGPSRAERIVAYRARHAFKKVVELARVKGIGLKTVRKLKPWLTVSGPTTATGRIAMPRDDS